MSFQAGEATKRSISKVSATTLLVGLLALAGCGSSSSSSSSTTATTASTPTTTTATPTTTGAAPATSGATQVLALAADPQGQLKYNTTSLSAKAGAVSIAFANAAPVGHNVTVESSSGASLGATPTFEGGAKTLKLNLKPGTYKFFCSVPGHRQAGMEGTLTVK